MPSPVSVEQPEARAERATTVMSRELFIFSNFRI